METTTLYGRVVRSHGGKLHLRESSGCLSIDVALEHAGLDDGDVVAITVQQRAQPLPPLNLKAPDGRPLGTPAPVSYLAEARVPDALRHSAAYEVEETEVEPVA